MPTAITISLLKRYVTHTFSVEGTEELWQGRIIENRLKENMTCVCVVDFVSEM